MRLHHHPRRWTAAIALAALSAAGMATLPASSAETQPPASSPTGPQPSSLADTLQADLVAVTQEGAIGVVGAARGPGAYYSGGSGVRSIDAARPVRRGDSTRIGSITKSMVATLALQEVDRGRWSLSTTVDEVWPGLLPGRGDVTLEQLLSHRTGLPGYLEPLLASAQSPDELIDILSRRYTDRGLVRTARTQPWLFPPGTEFSYSNTNYVVLGLMLARANHRPVGALLERRIFRPAQMHSAQFPVRSWPRRRVLSDYALIERPYNLDRTSPTLPTSAGAVVASSRDLNRFYRALFAGRLVSPELLESMITPRSSQPNTYGLGIYAVGDPCPDDEGRPQALYGHDGATFGTQTMAFTSADGTRQASVSWTGSEYVEPSAAGELANQFLVDAFVATCPSAAPTPGAGAKTRRQLDDLLATRQQEAPLTGLR